MATSTIKSNYARILATANANQTYAAQIAVLATTYNSLSDTRKQKCIVRSGNAVYHLVNMVGAFARYTQGKSANTIQWYGGLIDFSDNSYWTINNATSANSSNDVNTNSLQLCLL